jgi:hypothetical protein
MIDDTILELAEQLRQYPTTEKEWITLVAREADIGTSGRSPYKVLLGELLGYSMKEISNSFVDIAQSYMYLHDHNFPDISKLIQDHPALIGHSQDVLGAHDLFYVTKGFSVEQRHKIASKNPFAYAESLHVLASRMENLERYGINVVHAVTQLPSLLGLNIANVDSKIAFFRDFGIPEQEMGVFIGKKPQVLSFSIENNLRPTCTYLMQEMGVELSNIIATPSMLTASLENRIKPRHAFLKELDRFLTPGKICTFSDERFCEEVGVTLLEYTTFLEKSKERCR